MDKVILVVAAHPDDEALGCGATMARHVADGDKVFVFFMADGVSSRSPSNKSDDIALRNTAASNACQILGAKILGFAGFPDNKMDTISLLDMVKPIEAIIADIQPNIVYTHHFGDLNIDHKKTFEAVLTACRPLPNSFVTEIYCFEVLSSTEWAPAEQSEVFTPNYFVNVSAFMEQKIASLKAYGDEMCDFPHSRSLKAVEALATYRGASVGVPAAEAFYVQRLVKR